MSGSTSKKFKHYMGVDPTTKGIAYTIIRSEKRSKPPVFVASGRIETGDFVSFVETCLLHITVHRVRVLGIEIPGQFGKIGFEGAYLPITAMWVGALTSAVRNSGLNVDIHFYPSQVNKKNTLGDGWRYYLFGRRTKKTRAQWDAWTKEMVENPSNIIGYPKRSNKDVRDSTAIAIALRKACGKNEKDSLGCFDPENYHNYIVSGRKK